MEKILCAAIWYKEANTPELSVTNVDKGAVICAHRHGQVIGLYNSLTGKRTPETKYEQGFLTSENRFVGREDAAKIAFQAGQITDATNNFLFSEDLY